MIIKHFEAYNVFGYMQFDIDFNSDINFLVGGNGSGKTTALKLMNALMNPNFHDLITIQFEYICVVLENRGEIYKISARGTNDEKYLEFSGINETISLPCISSSEFDLYGRNPQKLSEVVENISRTFADHPVVRKISEIESPIFLGLDRRRETTIGSKDDFFRARDHWDIDKNTRLARTKRLIKGSIGTSLMETEMLVQHSYRRLRELENKYSSKLRNSILMSAFKYESIEEVNFSSGLNDKGLGKAVLFERQKEIKEALKNVVGEDSGLSDEVDKFFNQITKLFKRMSSKDDGITLEWLLNKAQIGRMTQIVEIIDDHKSKIDKLFRPINGFLDTINDFYIDSNKKLVVNTVGQLVVQRPNGDECTIEGLSSGERQLLVIFARAFFRSKSSSKMVFIIDEPELSLHLGWQEKFSKTIFEITPHTQFILATHSPEIVGNKKSKAVRCRK